MRASRGGFVAAVDALAVGQAAQLAGAGRRTVDDAIDPAAGVVLARVVGDEVAAGDLLATVYARDAGRRERAAAVLETAFTLADERPRTGDVVLGRGCEASGRSRAAGRPIVTGTASGVRAAAERRARQRA